MNTILLTVLIVPIIMLVVSLIYIKFCPKKITLWNGYSTRASRSSEKNWNFANKISFRYMLVLSIIWLVVSIVFLLLSNNFALEVCKAICITTEIAEILSLLSIYPFVEISLKYFNN